MGRKITIDILSEISFLNTWIWLRKGNPKRDTESLLIATKKQNKKTTPNGLYQSKNS